MRNFETKPDEAAHRAYLRFLESRGHSVASVTRFQANKDPVKVGHGMGLLISMFKDATPEEKDGITFALRAMTGQADLNDFIRGMSNRLIGELRPFFPQLPATLGCFIFPTNEFNAVCTYSEGTYLILIHPGVFELVEHVVHTAVSKWPERERSERIATAIVNFFEDGKLPEPYQQWPPGLDGKAGAEWRNVANWLVTAAEEFALCHEFGHAFLGHVGGSHGLHSLPLGSAGPFQTAIPLEIIARRHEQEFEADLWASLALLNRYAKQNRDSMAYACAGSEIFLGIADILDGLMAKQSGRLITTHPATILRQFAITGMHRRLDLGEYVYFAQRFEAELGSAAEVLGIDRPMPGRDELGAIVNIVDHFMSQLTYTPAKS